MKIGYYIGTLLYRHDCVIIPNFGGFIARYVPAAIHPVHHTFTPPSRQIMFNASLLHNDGLLGSFIAGEEGITFTEALGRIADELDAIRDHLKAGKPVKLEGIGTLKLNREENIEFSPLASTNWLEDAFGLTTFVSPQIRRDVHRSRHEGDNKATITIPVGMRRLAAIALPLLAVGLWSLFNQDRIGRLTASASSLFPSEMFTSMSRSSIERKIPVYVLSHAHTVQPVQQNALNVTPPVVAPKVKGNEQNEPASDVVVATAVHSTSPAPTRQSESSIQAGKPNDALSAKDSYRIICGAFKVRENAEKLIARLKSKNIDATLAGQNKKGLLLVSSSAGDTIAQAELKLKEIKAAGIDAAWILQH